jgi:hypothetical protein
VDLDTFATYVYVIVDECCKECFGPERHPGPAATLSRSEVLTLALIEQWGDFAHERAFWEAVEQHLRPAFPALVDRTDFNRQLRGYRLELARLSLALGEEIATTPSSYQVMDSVDVAVRNVKRRGASCRRSLKMSPVKRPVKMSPSMNGERDIDAQGTDPGSGPQRGE